MPRINISFQMLAFNVLRIIRAHCAPEITGHMHVLAHIQIIAHRYRYTNTHFHKEYKVNISFDNDVVYFSQ